MIGKKLFLLFVVLFSVVQFHQAQEVNGINYEIRGNGVYVIARSDGYSGTVTIPSSVRIGNKSYNVTGIDDYAFKECTGLISVTIPSHVVYIGVAAFQSCIGLTTVTYNAVECSFSGNTALPPFWGCTSFSSLTIGSSVKTIPAYLFKYCEALKTVSLPSSITSIGTSAFEASGILRITIPEKVTSIGAAAFSSCRSLGTVVFNAINCSSVPGRSLLFEGCQALSEIIIGNNVQTIPAYFFRNCSGVKEITIPASVTTIGNHAFERCITLATVNFNAKECTNSGTEAGLAVFPECTSLKTVNIGTGVTRIPENIFSGCSGLTSVAIPKGVKTIGGGSFKNCTSLESVIFSAADCSYSGTGEDGIFENCFSLKSIAIGNPVTAGAGNSVKSIPDYFAPGCTSLTTVSFHIYFASYTIGKSAFRDCTNLTAFDLTKCTSIGASAFSGCRGLKEINLESDMAYIGDSAFENCKGLTSVTYRATKCQYMGSASGPVFSGCTAVTKLDLGNRATAATNKIHDYAFSGLTGLTSVSIPSSVTAIGNSAFEYCTNLASVTFSVSSATSDNHRLATIGENAFLGCAALKEIKLPESVTSLERAAFSQCESMTNAVLGNGIKEINEKLFAGCFRLKSVSMGNQVKFIGDQAFDACLELTSITLPATIESIGKHAFSGNAFESIIVPDNVISIGEGAFSLCLYLKNITIGSSVRTMGPLVFDGCTRLDDIYAKGYIPATCQSNTFENVAITMCTLHVPKNSGFSYSTATGWKDFLRIEEEGVTNIHNVSGDDKSNSFIIYSAEGTIIVEGAFGEEVTVWDISGHTVCTIIEAAEIEYVPVKDAGVYIIQIGKGKNRFEKKILL